MSDAHRRAVVADVPRQYAGRPDGDRPVLGVTEPTRSWRDIDTAADQLAAGLAAAGLQPGARVAALLPNCVEYVEIMYGVARAGCVIVPLNTRSSGPEIERALRFAGAAAAIVDERFLATVAPIVAAVDTLPDERLVVLGDQTRGRTGYAELLAAARPGQLPRPCEDDVYWMPFTSGTTGVPKASLVTHRALVEQWRVVEHEFELRRSDTMLVAGPFYHSLGFLFGLSALFAGGRLLVHPDFDPGRVVDAIEHRGATVMPAVPTMYTLLLAELERRPAALASMRAVVSAGSPLHTATKLELLERFPGAGLYELYGSTEVGIATVLRPEDQRRKERSVGLPVRGAEVRLVDDAGAEVPPGTPGEVEKRGLLLGPRYWRNEADSAAIEHDGWIATGDIGVQDDEGHLSIVDRKKDMIVSGGANVFPAEIEAVIAGDPAVLEVAVIGVPDPVWGEAVTAVVVPRPGHELDRDALVQRCAAELADFKKPRRIEVVGELPKSGAGKVLKRELRERFWAEAGSRVG